MRTRMAILLALGLLAVTARADWTTVTGVGTGPRDVWIRDGGAASPAVFSVHTSGTAFLVEDPGGTASATSSLPCATCRGTWISDLGGLPCLNALEQDGTWLDCGAITAETLPTGALGINSSRTTEALSAFAETRSNSGTRDLWYGQSETPWTGWFLPVVLSGATNAALAAVRRGTDDYGLVVRLTGIEDSYLAQNNVAGALPPFTFSGGTPSWADLQALPDGFLRGIAAGTIGAQVITYDLDAGTVDPVDVPSLGAAPYAVSAVALREGMGDQYGDGVGFLLVPSAGYANVYRAIPDPSAPGIWWTPTSVAPPALTGGVYDVVRCFDSTYCVLASMGSTATNVVTYRNANQPVVDRPAFVMDEGASNVVLGLDAGDPDGDGVFVTWEMEDAGSTFLSGLTPAPGVRDGTIQQVSAIPANANLCGVAFRDVSVDAVVSDGVASHVRRETGFIRVRRTSVPVAPDGGPFPVPAGSPAADYDLPFAAPLCGVTSVSSSILQQDATPEQLTTSLAGSAVRVTFQPPRVWCSAAPGRDTYSLVLNDAAMSSDAGAVSFLVLPWGEPEAPFAPGRVEVQDAGTTVTYGRDGTHECADAGGFPGTDTTWTWSAGGFSTPPAILKSDGTPLPPGGGVTPSATVVAPDCVSGVITFLAFNTTGDGGMTGADAGMTVDVVTTLAPISSGSAILTADAGAGEVVGRVDLSSDLNCPSLRAATADVVLFRDDGGVVSADSGVPVPGPYQLPAPGACGGGLFFVEATVSDSTGALLPVREPVTLPLRPAGIDSLDVPDFIISCGDAGVARATATIGPTSCPTAQVTWSSSGAVAIAPATGTPVDLVTASTDFGGLIGMPVDVTATATSETGSASLPAQALVRPDRLFISVTHRSDTPVASEARVLGVEVTLTNDTACDVSGVEWHESLNGLSWIEGSVQAGDGDAGVGAALDGGALVVSGLSLPAGQSLTLRYSARPTLFGNPSPGGVAVLRSVPISEPSGLTPGESTCGCQSAAGAWPALFGLAALALLRRRRLPRRSRDFRA